MVAVTTAEELLARTTITCMRSMEIEFVKPARLTFFLWLDDDDMKKPIDRLAEECIKPEIAGAIGFQGRASRLRQMDGAAIVTAQQEWQCRVAPCIGGHVVDVQTDIGFNW